ncbi:hypothetical protein [Virgisporangium ochraceum]|nr:hypothetical protein [Virgisporangium ochraceum]
MTGRGWAYIGATLGGAVSVAANVAHSYVPPADARPGWSPETGAVISAVFWPVALFAAVEILARVPWPAGGRWLAARFLGLLPVALVAAFVSYRHLSGLLAHYGEDRLTVAVGPLAVDGLMVMATAALIATATRRGAAAALDTQAATVIESAAPVEVPSVDLPAAEDAPPTPATNAAPAGRSTTRTARPRTSRRPPSAVKVEKAAARMPGATVAAIAAKAGVSETTVRRYLPDNFSAPVAATLPPANGTSPAVTPVLADAA